MSAPSRGDRAGQPHRVVGDHAHRAPLDARQRRQHLGGEALAQHRHGAGVRESLERRADFVSAPASLGHHVAQGLLIGLVPLREVALEVRHQPFGHGDGLSFVGHLDVDDAVGALHGDRADRVRLEAPEAAALDHRGPAHAERDVLRGDDQVRGAREHRVAREAAPGDDGDARDDPGERCPEGERARVERRDHGVVGVPRAPAAALREQDRRQAHALDQLEQAVLLAVAGGALGPGQHRVVVGDDGACGAVAVEFAVHPRGPADQAVGRRACDQLRLVAAHALGGDGEPAVLDEAVLVDKVGEVLARGPAALRVSPLDRLRPRLVAGQPPALEHLGEVVSNAVLSHKPDSRIR